MNILIIRFSSLGDLVTLEPTFRAIRYFYEDSKISFLTTGIGKGLYQDSNYFDEYILHKSVFSSIQKLKNNKYDIVINLQCNKPSHYINFFLKKDLVVNKSYSFKDKLLGLKVKSKTIREIIEATKSISLNKIDKYFDEVQELIKLPVRQKSLLENLTSDKKYIAISTGTSERWLSKKWGIDNYSSLISKLIENNFQIILVGSALELEDSEILLKKYPQIISFVNKTDLTELKNLLANVDIFIGNDSGPAHIAAGVGTNTLTIFGSTDIKHCVKFMPYTGSHEYLKPNEEIKCHPCYKTKCPTNMECMQSIKVENILEKVRIIND
ncbi:MAG: glycosyltransferase family 9 protein [Arcobacter sp.]|uniref:glycosyltransferase family 9 protein n=1 Tax=Arcobacter sp. TaxID=1872629 RepID=UPI002587DDD8|nr:glycosyltransferase family 9 protein [Arcobacter sp.]MDD3008327.1 glycosyltransferase family 9 protein [Arcobacter sp.]